MQVHDLIICYLFWPPPFTYEVKVQHTSVGHYVAYTVHSKRNSDSTWTANGRPMFGPQTDINLPKQLFVHNTSDNRLLSNVWIFFL